MYYRASKSKSASGSLWWVLYLLFFGLYFIVAETGGCSVNEGRFKTTLRSEGLTGGKQGGYDWFECGTGDVWVSRFTAARDGNNASGTMCCGIFKGCTVRWQ